MEFIKVVLEHADEYVYVRVGLCLDTNEFHVMCSDKPYEQSDNIASYMTNSNKKNRMLDCLGIMDIQKIPKGYAIINLPQAAGRTLKGLRRSIEHAIFIELGMALDALEARN